MNNLALFRLKLLTRCQQEFLKDWLEKLNEVRNDPNLNEDDKTEKEILLKKRYTGHMIFIGNLPLLYNLNMASTRLLLFSGELFLLDLVRSSTMRDCVARLMDSKEVILLQPTHGFKHPCTFLYII